VPTFRYCCSVDLPAFAFAVLCDYRLLVSLRFAVARYAFAFTPDYALTFRLPPFPCVCLYRTLCVGSLFVTAFIPLVALPHLAGCFVRLRLRSPRYVYRCHVSYVAALRRYRCRSFTALNALLLICLALQFTNVLVF